jgi:lipoprotein-anchoring transpeptidase ErfK/SrfK/ketosteroid isomerase-like protein
MDKLAVPGRPAGFLRLQGRLMAAALLLAALSASPALHAKPAKTKAKPVAAKPAPAKSRAPASRALVAGAATAVAAGGAAAAVSHKPKAAGASQSQAEARLLAIIRQVEQRDLDGALKAAADLTADVPNFRAAQLVYADLLRFKTGRGSEVLAGTPVAAPAPAAAGGARTGVLVKHNLSVGAVTRLEATQASPSQIQLQALQDELKRRLHADSASPPAGAIPSDFLMLGASVRHAIAIDASKSRLYLFAHEDGGLRLLGDFYVSVGKLGTDKWQEGDQRTPLGIYFVGRHIPGPRLPEFYGKGALTVNFPNDWDKAVGRSGSGIWLHGSPPDQFSRAPEASDGCLVLANPDLTLLMQTVDRQTPVLIRDQLQWVAPKALAQQRAAESFLRVIDEWKSAWHGTDLHRLAAVYTDDFLQSASARGSQERLTAYFNSPGVTLKDLSVYSWKDGQGEIRVVNLRASSKAFADGLPLRQYWRKTGGRWRIFSEDVMG